MPQAVRQAPIASAFLPIRPRPQTGEHPGGYLRRLALANGFDSLDPLRSSYRLRAVSPDSDETTWRHLAIASGRADHELAVMRWPPAPGRPGALLMFGSEMRVLHADRTHMAICPICLAADGVLRQLWSLHMVTACPIHGCRLAGVCPSCGTRNQHHSRRRIWECVDCHNDLLHASASPADEREVTLSKLIARTAGAACGITPADGAVYPAEVEALPLNDLLSLAAVLGAIAVTASNDRPVDADRVRPISLLPEGPDSCDMGAIARAAHEVLAGWPHAYRALLEELVDRNQAPTQRTFLGSRMGTEAGILALRPIVDVRGHPIAIAATEFGRFAEERLSYKVGQRLPSADGLEGRAGDLISLNRAMELLEGRANADPEPWLQADLLERHVVGAGAWGFSLRDVEDLLDALAMRPLLPPNEHSIPLSEARMRLRSHLPASSLLRAIFKGPLAVHGDRPPRHAREVRVDARDLLKLTGAARLAAHGDDDGWVPLGSFNRFMADCDRRDLQLAIVPVRALVRRGLLERRPNAVGGNGRSDWLYPLHRLWDEAILGHSPERLADVERFLPRR